MSVGLAGLSSVRYNVASAWKQVKTYFEAPRQRQTVEPILKAQLRVVIGSASGSGSGSPSGNVTSTIAL